MFRAAFIVVGFLFLISETLAQPAEFSLMGSYGQPIGGEGGIYGVTTEGSGFRLIKKFSSNPDGQNPTGALLRTDDGYIYGVCQSGGTGTGTIFEMKEDGTDYHVIHTFDASTLNPLGGLVLGQDGYLFGTTNSGGNDDGGTIYKLKRDGSGFVRVHNFGPRLIGRRSRLVTDSDGTIYGVGSNVSTEHSIFKLSANGSDFTYLHNFTGMPSGTFVMGELLLASNGYLYGTTAYDGENQKGTLFRVKKDGTSFSKLLDFPANYNQPPEGNLVELGGKLYGTVSSPTGGMWVFAVMLDGTNLEVVAAPDALGGGNSAGLTVTADGKLVGVNRFGAFDGGVIFKMDADGGNFNVLQSFTSFTMSIAPVVIASNGDLIGTREYGAVSQNGYVYRFPVGGPLTIAKEFPQPEGAQPMGNLVQGPEGFYFGVTQRGGTYGTGVIFKMKKNGSSFQVLHNFDRKLASNGLFVDFSAPIIGSDNLLYGTTTNAGVNNRGSVYRVDLDGQNYQTLVHFDGTGNGAHPAGNLLESDDGFLYGLTLNGGTYSSGVIFKMKKDGTSFQKLHEFNGMQVYGNSLVEGTDNYLLGLVPSGGTNQMGVLFRIKKDGSGFEVMKNFDALTGQAIMGGTLTLHPDGNYYGITGVYMLGPSTLFRITGNGTGFQVMYTFAGIFTANSLTLAPDGYFYCTTDVADKLLRIKNDGTGFRLTTLLSNLIFPRPLNPNFTIIQRDPQAITFGALPSLTWGDPTQTLSATSDSGLPIEYSSSNTSVATISGNTLTIKGAGTTTITASQPGDALYKPAETISQGLTVAKASQTITFAALEQKTMPVQPFTLHATSTSGLPVVYTNSNTAVATISGNVVTVIASGTTTITASQAGNNNYLAAPDVPRELVVVKQQQTITFAALEQKKIPVQPFELQGTSTSALALTYTSSNTAVATISGKMVTVLTAGTTTITASQAGNNTYLAASEVSLELVVIKGDQTITFPEISNKVIGDPPFTLNATVSSPLTITYSTTSNKATISGNTVTIVNPGRVTIKAEQGGNASYNAATPVERTFCILPLRPTMTVTVANSTVVLTSSNAVGNQWYKDGVAIENATQTTFETTDVGSYTVNSSVDGCATGMSNAFVVMGVRDEVQTVISYTNPVSTSLTVRVSSAQDTEIQFQLIDLLGRSTISSSGWTNSDNTLEVAHLTTGIYILQVRGARTEAVRIYKD